MTEKEIRNKGIVLGLNSLLETAHEECLFENDGTITEEQLIELCKQTAKGYHIKEEEINQ